MGELVAVEVVPVLHPLEQGLVARRPHGSAAPVGGGLKHGAAVVVVRVRIVATAAAAASGGLLHHDPVSADELLE